MSEHGSRGHAAWSASASHGNIVCQGRLAACADLPEQTSEAADWGTCAHQISEKCFALRVDADTFIGTTEKGKVHEFEVDEEMAETAQTYLDYCRGRVALYKQETGKNALIFVEEYLSLEAINPPFDAGGTGDFVAIFPEWKELEVVDLKGGRGVVVEAIGNPQPRHYGLGAALKHRGHDIQKVKVTIVQPRASHPKGRIRSETFHIADLLEWTTDLLVAMGKSKKASDEYQRVLAGDLSMAEWSSTYLVPGGHCADTFCKARATCPALRQQVEDKVGLWFEEGQPRLANVPTTDDPNERASMLDSLDMIEDFVKAVRAREHALAEGGNPATGYILVPKEGREKWVDAEAEKKAIAAAKAAGLPEAKYLNPGKVRTPKQVRKELGAKANLVSGLSATPTTGTNLVKATNTTREAVPGKAERYFEPSTEQKD